MLLLYGNGYARVTKLKTRRNTVKLSNQKCFHLGKSTAYECDFSPNQGHFNIHRFKVDHCIDILLFVYTIALKCVRYFNNTIYNGFFFTLEWVETSRCKKYKCIIILYERIILFLSSYLLLNLYYRYIRHILCAVHKYFKST